MTIARRADALRAFEREPAVTVLIVSLKAAATGLNLTCACNVVLLDLWWNPTVEEQAIDRAHRIGQTRPVTVTRIVVRSAFPLPNRDLPSLVTLSRPFLCAPS